MRIPPSAIVMTLLCAVPFGLAIRDAHRDKQVSHDEDSDLSELDTDYRSAERMQRERAEEAERAAREEAERQERKLVAKLVVGRDAASLGELFEGVHLGAPAGNFQPDKVRESIESHHEVLSVDWDVTQSQLDGVRVTILGEDDCESLVHELDAWGTGVDGRWANAATHERAEFDRVACSLHFERYADVDTWLGNKPGAIVPLDMIGHSASDLHFRVMPKLDADADTDDSFGWHDVGLAGAMGKTTLTAFQKNNKVVAIEVNFQTDAAGIDAIEARVTKLVGAKPTRPTGEDDDPSTVAWKGRVPVTLTTGDISSLTIGTIPE